MNGRTTNTGRGERARKRRHGHLAVLLIIAVVICIGAGAVYTLMHRQLGGHTVAEPPANVGDPQPQGPTYHGTNILLMGVDQRPGDYGRADTMLLLSLDPDGKRTHVMSIPRDTMVDLPGHGRGKINAAYAYGGPQLAKQAVANLTGLPIHYYIKVNLQGFTKLIDLVGGIDIDVQHKMDYEDPTQSLYIHLKPGPQHMDGATALGYVRFRGDAQADLGRIERQQGFLMALGQQILRPSILPRVPALIGQTAQMLSTDIPTTDKLTLAMSGYSYYHNETDMSILPGEAQYVDGISYFITDTEQLQSRLASWIAQ